MDRGEGYVKSPRLSTRGGEGVKNGQNLVHVDVECPLTGDAFRGSSFNRKIALDISITL